MGMLDSLDFLDDVRRMNARQVSNKWVRILGKK